MSANPRILFISSANPLKGPGRIGLNMYLQLKDAKFDVDMMTLYPVESQPEIVFIKKSDEKSIFERIIKKTKRLLCCSLPGSPYYFFYRRESHPPIPSSLILDKIKRQYDWVIIYFWQDMLSFMTVKAIYDKLNRPVVFFIPPDFSHMSGGCHFPGDCQRYKVGCGNCPAIHSKDKDDFTHWNILYRKKFYDEVKPIVFGNTYMHSFYKESYLLKNAITVNSIPQLNTKLYYPLEKSEVRVKYGMPSTADFVISFGCQQLNDPRKGMKYLIEALNLLKQKLNDTEKNRIILVAIGDSFNKIKNQFPFQSKSLGFIPIEQLPEFYSLADIFVCPSINDPGPSMVGQSIACGTPVIGFEMGALLDLVKGKGTGCCVKLKDVSKLADSIEEYFRMSVEQRIIISTRCRNFALGCNPERRLRQWLDLYEKYKTS